MLPERTMRGLYMEWLSRQRGRDRGEKMRKIGGLRVCPPCV